MKYDIKIVIKEVDFVGLQINYQLYDSIFGVICIASTCFGVCYMEFCEIGENIETKLKEIFSESVIINNHSGFHNDALSIFGENKSKNEIKLHLKATKFQIDVWKILLKIPKGTLISYSEIAHRLGTPKASRAVGNAVSKNLIAVVIPCHRVIRKSGEIGNYKWGIKRKSDIINWERDYKINNSK